MPFGRLSILLTWYSFPQGPVLRFAMLLMIGFFSNTFITQAQDKQTVQIKTFDSNLQAYKNIALSINDKEFITIGERGVAVVELNASDLPVKSITLRDEKLEAASWNFSKGVLEIIVRSKSYTIVPFLLQYADGKIAPPSEITFLGVKTLTVMSNEKGEFKLPISLQDKISSVGQFRVPGFRISKIIQTGSVNLLVVEPPKVETKIIQEPALEPGTFDVAVLDSINSLTMFYSVFKNVFISDLDDDVRQLVDAKFKTLIAQLQDSLSINTSSFMGSISDSSFVDEDIRSLVNYATVESEKLQANREDFQKKIDVIADKLGRGITSLSETERKILLTDLDVLEKLLVENEGKFYQNQNDYKAIINTLKEKYFDIENLQTRLSETEKQREEEQRLFQMRLFIIGGVVILFAILIVILSTFSNRLRKQSKDLKAANEEINTINENLEKIVIKRTELLENSNKELDTFLYRASHDLRSPIRSILGLCNIYHHIPQPEYVSLVSETTQNMDRMLKKLSAISEISRESLNLSTISLSEFMQQTASGYQKLIAESKIQFHIDCSEEIIISTSEALMNNILISLLENALFFNSLKKSDHRRVEITARKNESEVTLEVYDNGIGIADDIKPKIFNMFYKGNEMAKGNGLGLYMVQKSVQALFGKVMVESEEGRYSKFTIMLPVQH